MAQMSATAEDSQFDLVDLTGMSLADLSDPQQGVFAHSLSRILEEIDRPQDAVAGWQSAM
jgi:FXSXX-COOH protein